jgi:hypothetical protein
VLVQREKQVSLPGVIIAMRRAPMQGSVPRVAQLDLGDSQDELAEPYQGEDCADD